MAARARYTVRMTIERVPDKTPILDSAESAGGRIGLIARIVRPFKEVAERWQRRRHQKYIDRTYHDRLRVGAKDE